MRKQVSLLHSVAVIAAVPLSLSMLSVAHAGHRTDGAMDAKTHAARSHIARTHIARTHHLKPRKAEIPARIYGAAPDLPECTGPYQNEFPPCMSTWPEGSPDYHGSNGL